MYDRKTFFSVGRVSYKDTQFLNFYVSSAKKKFKVAKTIHIHSKHLFKTLFYRSRKRCESPKPTYKIEENLYFIKKKKKKRKKGNLEQQKIFRHIHKI